jgi:hypothetical protein
VAASLVDPGTGASSGFLLGGWDANQANDHNNPAFVRLGDGRILATYSRHHMDAFWFHRTSLGPSPASDRDFAAQARGPGLPAPNSYSNLLRLSEGQLLFQFSRAINYNPTLCVSTNEGLSWSAPQHFLRSGSGGFRPYTRFCGNGRDRWDMVYNSRHPQSQGSPVYHLFYRAGNLCRSDGSIIRSLADTPLMYDESESERGTLVYPYSEAPWGQGQGPDDYLPGGRAWVWDIQYGKDGHPVCVFSVQRSNLAGVGWPHNRIYYYYARWTGTAWQRRLIAQGGRNLYPAEGHYAGGICIDPDDTRVVYVSSNAANPADLSSLDAVPLSASGHYEIHRGFTGDGGLSFAWNPITADSTADNLRPVVPQGHGRSHALLWFQGTYASFTEFDTRVLGRFGPKRMAFGEWLSAAGPGTGPGLAGGDTNTVSLLYHYATSGVRGDPASIPPSIEGQAFLVTVPMERGDLEWTVEASADLRDWAPAAILRPSGLPDSPASGFRVEAAGASVRRVVPSHPLPGPLFYRLKARLL